MATAVGVPATGGVTSPVFQPGKHQPAEAEIYIDYLPLTIRKGGHMVVAPTEAGKYPVLVFLHGTDLKNNAYTNLLQHVASHGFIVVAPQLLSTSHNHGEIRTCVQLYAMTFTTDDSNDIDNTKKATNWLADPEKGLLQTLKNKFNSENKPIFPGVEPDLTKLAMAGHSRGGHTAFATALGLGHAEPELKLSLSALIGVDPVAGLFGRQMESKVLPKVSLSSGSFNLNGMPVLVLGTGISPQNCAPAGFNHVDFYQECNPPCYHFVVTKYGHLDMLDDGANHIVQQLMKCFCQSNKDDPKELAKRTIGGLVVAFLRASLQGNDEDIKAIVENPGLAPAQLNQPVEYDLPKSTKN